MSGGIGGAIKLWDVATHEEIATFTGHEASLTGLAFSPDAAILASGGRDGAIKLWEVATRQEIATLAGHTADVNSLAFSPNGSVLASGSDDGAKMWSVETGREIAALAGHEGGVNAVAFSPDGRSLATGGADHTVVLWDVATARETAALTAHGGPVIMVAFDPNGGALVSGRSARGGSEADLTEDAIRVWDVAARRQTASFGPASSAVRWLTFSPDGQTLVAADWSRAGQIVVWDIASGSRVATLTGYVDKVWSPVFSPDGSILGTGGADEVTLWDAITWRPTAILPGVGRYPTFSPDGATLATLVDQDIALWDVASARRVATLAAPDGARALTFSPDGTMLAGGGSDYAVRLWDVPMALNAARTHGPDVRVWVEMAALTGHDGIIPTLAFSPDGALLASGSRDATVKLWDIATGGEVASLQYDGRAYAVDFSPDGRTVAVDGLGSSARLWDVASGQQIATFGEHWDFHYTLDFSPDGYLLATGSDGVYLWGVTDSQIGPTAVDARGRAGATWARVKRDAMTPSKTAFLPNYPNPFNPETWIPFDLRSPPPSR